MLCQVLEPAVLGCLCYSLPSRGKQTGRQGWQEQNTRQKPIQLRQFHPPRPSRGRNLAALGRFRGTAVAETWGPIPGHFSPLPALQPPVPPSAPSLPVSQSGWSLVWSGHLVFEPQAAEVPETAAAAPCLASAGLMPAQSLRR